MNGRPEPPRPTGSPPPGHGADDARAEQVLSQALRVLAGGEKPSSTTPTADRSSRRRPTTGQLILLAAIVGLLIGIAAGFISLML